MAKIQAPNPQYNGVSAGVTFVNGVGTIDDSNVRMIGWFQERGYEVELDETDDLPNLDEIKGDDLRDFYRAHLGDPGEKKAKELRAELRTAGHGK